MIKQGERCGGSKRGSPGHVDGVRDHGKEGGTGSFVYIEYDQASKCIHLPPPPRPDSAPCTSRASFCFPKTGNMCVWGGVGGGGMEAEKRETERGSGNMFRRK